MSQFVAILKHLVGYTVSSWCTFDSCFSNKLIHFFLSDWSKLVAHTRGSGTLEASHVWQWLIPVWITIRLPNMGVKLLFCTPQLPTPCLCEQFLGCFIRILQKLLACSSPFFPSGTPSFMPLQVSALFLSSSNKVLRNQEKNKDNWYHRIHNETNVEMGRSYSKNKTIGGPNAAQSGNQGEGRGREDDQPEDGKMT